MARGVRALANTCRHYAWREYDVAISKYLYQADQGKINAAVATLLPPCIALSAVAGAAGAAAAARICFCQFWRWKHVHDPAWHRGRRVDEPHQLRGFWDVWLETLRRPNELEVGEED